MMNTLESVKYNPLSYELEVEASLNDSIVVTKTNKFEFHAKVDLSNGHLSLIEINRSELNSDLLEIIALEYLLGHNEEIKTVSLNSVKVFNELSHFVSDNGLHLSRGEFFELRAPWYKEKKYTIPRNEYIKNGDLLYPKRPHPRSGILYKRYVPAIKANLSFRVLELDKDLDVFHEWHNQERVNFFWELKGSKDDHINYINKVTEDNHTIPLIAEIDGIPYGYFELYWAYEDRLGPYYSSNQFDRGFHFLIGNSNFLGAVNTDAAIKSILHLSFLDDARTTKLMAEPRADNARVIKYVDSIKVWRRLYEFDFPHKRALLIEAKREVFFTEGLL